jgi:hypothetical protein
MHSTTMPQDNLSVGRGGGKERKKDKQHFCISSFISLQFYNRSRDSAAL